MLKFAAGVLFTLLAIVIGYFFFLRKDETITLPVPESKVTITPAVFIPDDKTATASSDSVDPSGEGFVNPSATIDAIETSLETKVYTNLEPYLLNTVIVTLGATECCGSMTKEKTIQQLSYLNEATLPWDLTATNPIAKQLTEKDPLNFKDTVTGTSANRFAVAFKLNNEYLIEKIFIIADYKLILGE